MITNGHQTGKSIFFLGEVQGTQPLYKLDIARKTISPVVTGKAISEFDFDNKGMVCYCLQYDRQAIGSVSSADEEVEWNSCGSRQGTADNLPQPEVGG